MENDALYWKNAFIKFVNLCVCYLLIDDGMLKVQ